jgi:hypothetical protein
MVEPTDSEALRASRTDPRAFVTIFERHFDAVNRYLRRSVSAGRALDRADPRWAALHFIELV